MAVAELEAMEACALGVRSILAVPRKVRTMEILDWAATQSPLDLSFDELWVPPLQLIEQEPYF